MRIVKQGTSLTIENKDFENDTRNMESYFQQRLGVLLLVPAIAEKLMS